MTLRFQTVRSTRRVVAFAALASILFSLDVSASDSESVTVYRWERPDGTVEFSDEPRSGAEPVVVEQPMIAPAIELPMQSPTRAKVTESPVYRLLSIIEPHSEATYRNQQADAIEVVGKVQPGLRSGHQMFLLVDGQVSGEGGRDARFLTPRLERGRHDIQLQIRGADDALLIESETVGINVHRAIAPGSDPGGGTGPGMVVQ